jgi:hypothetical protein
MEGHCDLVTRSVTEDPKFLTMAYKDLPSLTAAYLSNFL